MPALHTPAMLVKHAKTSSKPDSGDTSRVNASDWNADHVVEGLAAADIEDATEAGVMFLTAEDAEAQRTLLAVAPVGPTFSAYLGSDQTIPDATQSKIQINTKNWDTDGAFDHVTNYRFQPSVPGYYQVNFSALLRNVAATVVNFVATLYKNGAEYARGTQGLYTSAPSLTNTVSTGSALVLLNGSTDYIELYGYVDIGSGTAQVAGLAGGTRMDAIFVRPS